MSSYESKTDKTKEQDIKEELKKGGYSEVVIDHWLNPRTWEEWKIMMDTPEKSPVPVEILSGSG